ncbi:MAG TPA: FeoC-like transcriptional regulator [Caldisericia bacterium]|nr:FeoC-like transcriptional regulator [Caldisericia bacterium]HPF48497.1 FeoC-like transcriptional regulator [Caldisericia bacterium]HPI83322.1 FeoC-like transcriptional regulator [Caldisericia bacterium]HPQ92952.1 FeoC-like transcriptional regulator [Caldisericia bacterium]HRV75214.1 FeoC-like transcriptional regulator [Caldisericia bacterium]
MLLGDILKQLSGKGTITRTRFAHELGVSESELSEALDMLIHLGKIEIVTCNDVSASSCGNCPNKGGCISDSNSQEIKTIVYRIKHDLK